jgi:hypothetical protein
MSSPEVDLFYWRTASRGLSARQPPVANDHSQLPQGLRTAVPAR